MSQILTALKALDVTNDNHWTADGLPRLDTVKMLASNQSLTREAVSAAAPGFTRATASTYAAQPAGGETSTPAQAAQPGPQGDNPQGQGGNTPDPANASGVAPQSANASEVASNFSGGETEQPEVADRLADGNDEIAALEAELEETSEYVEQIRVHLNEVLRSFEQARAREDSLREKLDALRPKDDDTNAIQAYLASQRRQLEDRAARKKLIRESGLDLKELARDLKAPIDAAMARKTGRGSRRPGQ